MIRPRKKTQTAAAIASLVFAGSVVVLAGLLYLIERTHVSLNEREEELARAHAYTEELTALARVVEESAEERETMATYVLREEEVIDFLALIETVAREQNVFLETTALDVAPLDDEFEELRAQVRMEGEYDALIHTLKLFETLPHQSRLANVTLSAEGAAGSGGGWTMTFQLFVTKYTTS